MKAFVIMGRVLKAAYDDLFLCVFLSLIWWACPIVILLLLGALGEWGAAIAQLPALLGFAGMMGLALVVLLVQPLVTMGAQHVANRIANYRRADSGFFWDAWRRYPRKGYLAFFLSLAIPALIAFQIIWYFNSQGWLQVIGVIWLWLFLFSLMAGQYFFPLLWQQDEPKILLALRNSALLALQYPLYSLLMLVFQLLLSVISIALTLPLILLLPALLALTGNLALVGILQDMGLAEQPPEAPVRG
jgi:hypothetical protein